MSRNFQIKAAANGTSAEIFIYGDIGESWWGESVAAKDFVQQIAALDVESLTIRINSYGGSVSDGLAIYNAIKRHKAFTTVTIDGVAFSIASLIAMAGDSVEIAENALLMIHAPWGSTSGNSAEMRKFADILDAYAESMAASYVAKAGVTREEILGLLTDGQDHYFKASEAVDAGYADKVVGAVAAQASFNLSRFKSLPAAAAAFTSKGNPVDKTTIGGATAPKDGGSNGADAAARQAILAADQARRSGIAGAFAKFMHVDGAQALMITLQDDVDCTVEAAGQKLLAHLASSASPAAGPRVVTVEDARDKFRAGASAALMHRAALAKDDSANQYRGFTMLDLARASLEQLGIKAAGMSKMEILAQSFTHTSSDFKLLLENVANKSMLKGFEEVAETFQLWTSEGTLSDFKASKRVDLSPFSNLLNVPEGQEYKYGSFTDRGATVQLATYGRMFSITRQAMINDDVDAFTKVPRSMGRAAKRLIGDLAYGILTANGAMSDGTALFHANHANLVSSGAGAPTTPAVDALQVLMGKQTLNNVTLNVALKYLLVPLALRGTAQVVRDSQFSVEGSKQTTIPNSVRSTFEVISDARLDKASATAWYGAADGQMFDTVEIQYLDGQREPTLEQRDGWNVDGTEFKVRMDVGAAALDWRGLSKNNGA